MFYFHFYLKIFFLLISLSQSKVSETLSTDMKYLNAFRDFLCLLHYSLECCCIKFVKKTKINRIISNWIFVWLLYIWKSLLVHEENICTCDEFIFFNFYFFQSNTELGKDVAGESNTSWQTHLQQRIFYYVGIRTKKNFNTKIRKCCEKKSL